MLYLKGETEHLSKDSLHCDGVIKINNNQLCPLVVRIRHMQNKHKTKRQRFDVNIIRLLEISNKNN